MPSVKIEEVTPPVFEPGVIHSWGYRTTEASVLEQTAWQREQRTLWRGHQERQPRLGSPGDPDIVDLDCGDSSKVLEDPHYLEGLKFRQACGEVWSFTGDSTS